MESTQLPKRSKRKLVLMVLSLFVIILLGGLTGAGLYAYQALRPMPQSSQEVRVVVAPGARPSEIAGELQSKGLIRDAKIFTYYLRYKKQGGRFQAGEYAMNPGITLDAIISKLNQGDIAKEAMIRLTIPEGFTVPQIADKLAKAAGQPYDQILKLADEPEPFHGKVIAALPDDAQLKHRLEGYLFPETYEFEKGATAAEMITRMLTETDDRLSGLGIDNERLQSLGVNLNQLLTVASMVEREVALDEERPLVASVIYNRLKKQMPLQIDATIQYLFDKPKERLTEKDLQLESPYNTYLHTGLPPGPIASPSLASVKAALAPAKTNYLFYVTKKDGSKGHLFAETYEEHMKNIAASKKQEGK